MGTRFKAKKKRIMYTPVIPTYYIKVGCKGVFITRTSYYNVYFFFLTARFFRERILKRLARLRDFVADIRSENGSLIFPSSIEGNVDITGKGLRHFLGQRVENVRLPIVEERRNDRTGRKQRMSLKVISHYENMSMQYTAIFHGCKNVHFQMIFFLYFSYFC